MAFFVVQVGFMALKICTKKRKVSKEKDIE